MKVASWRLSGRPPSKEDTKHAENTATTDPKDMAGNVNETMLRHRSFQGSTYPEDGNQPSHNEKARMRNIARRNWGMATPLTATTVPVVSTQVFGLRLDIIPMGMAIKRA